MLVVIFILGNIIAGAISVRQALENTEITMRAEMSPVTAISVNEEIYSVMFTQNPDFKMEAISIETIEKIGALPYVKYFDYSAMLSLETPSLIRYSSSKNQDMNTSSPSYFTFTGVNNPEIVDMQAGQISLVSGRTFFEHELKNLTYVALVSQEVANLNNLTVGSVMTFENNIYANDTNPEIPSTMQKYDFEIVGIFEPVKQVGIESVHYEDLENRMYTPNRVLNEAFTFQVDEYSKKHPEMTEIFKDVYYVTLYVLNDPVDLEPFREDVAALIPKYYTVKTTSNNYKMVEVSMESTQKITSLVLCIVVGCTVVTISLLVTLFLRDRKHELGLYLSLGERKTKVAAQIFLEVTIIAIVAITVSLFTGNMISGSFSERMIENQILAAQASETGYSFMDLEFRGYKDEVNIEDLLASYAVSLDRMTVFLFYVISFGTICASILVPIFYITRIKPKKILMDN